MANKKKQMKKKQSVFEKKKYFRAYNWKLGNAVW